MGGARAVASWRACRAVMAMGDGFMEEELWIMGPSSQREEEGNRVPEFPNNG